MHKRILYIERSVAYRWPPKKFQKMRQFYLIFSLFFPIFDLILQIDFSKKILAKSHVLWYSCSNSQSLYRCELVKFKKET